MSLARTVCAALVAAAGLVVASSNVQAADVPLNFNNFDTRTAGSFSTSAFSADGNGSLMLQTFDNTSQGKVSVIFTQAGLAPLGTLGNLNALAADFYKASNPATSSVNQFAYRVRFVGGQSLVWENNYNGNAVVTNDSWSTLNLATGNFWLNAGGVNYNGGSDAAPLSTWAAGGASGLAPTGVLNASSQIIGFEVAFGSGVSAFTGYVDNVRVGFGGATPVVYSTSFATSAAAVPLPASALSGGVLLAGLLIGRRSR